MKTETNREPISTTTATNGGIGLFGTEDLLALVQETAQELHQKVGPLASVVVMVSNQDGIHSYPAVWYKGACLPVIGLLEVGTKLIRDTMPAGYRP